MKNSFKNMIKFKIVDLLLPCWRVSGRKMTYFSEDFHEVHIEIPFKRINRGPHGYIYGGSLFSAADAIPALQYFLILGKNYVVWDKEATIHFKLPCKETLYIKNFVSPEEINEIKDLLETQTKLERKYTIELLNDQGVIHVVVEKTLHMRKNIQDGNHKHHQKRSPFL